MIICVSHFETSTLWQKVTVIDMSEIMAVIILFQHVKNLLIVCLFSGVKTALLSF